MRGQEPHAGLDHPDGRGSSSAGPVLSRVREEAEDDEGAESETLGLGGIDFSNLDTPLFSPRISLSREAPQEANTRNVRPRLGTELEPEAERTPSLSGSNAGYPPGLPAAADSIGEMPEPLRRHFTEARVRTEGPSELPEEGNYVTRNAYVAFMSARVKEDESFEVQEGCQVHQVRVCRSRGACRGSWMNPERWSGRSLNALPHHYPLLEKEKKSS